MLSLIVLGLLGVIYFVFYGSVNDPEVISTAKKLFASLDKLIKNNNWDGLLQTLDVTDCTSKLIENNSVIWISNDMPELSFLAKKTKDNKASIHICGSGNGTTKLYFGFSMLAPEDYQTSWIVSVSDSLLGYKATAKAKKLAIICTNILKKNGLTVAFEDNGRMYRIN